MKKLSVNPNGDINEIRKEYQSLKLRAGKTIDSFDLLFWIVHPVLTLAVTVFFAFRTLDLRQTLIAAVVYGYIPGVIASAVVTGLLDLAIGKRCRDYLESRRLTSSWYQKYQYLRSYIADYDEAEKLSLEEERRVRLQPVRDEVKRICNQVEEVNNHIRSSENTIWRKRKWYPEYREYEGNIETCISKLEDLREKGQLAKAKFGLLAEEMSYEFNSLFGQISNSRLRCHSVLGKMQGMKDWTPPVRTRTRAERDSTTTEVRRPRVSSRQTTIQQPVVVTPPQPPKRRVLTRQLKKIPLEDYLGAAMAKMTIGELGEVVALHYEIRRVEAETGVSFHGTVSRVSEHTDSVGYDIESFSQGEKVFIEVKSTSGSFWTDFYLSANERQVMNKLDEKYWLYRIFDLSKEDGSAKLSIFRGKAEIDASFELEAANYKFSPKTTSNGNGTLSYETLH